MEIYAGKRYSLRVDTEHPEQRDEDHVYAGGVPTLPKGVELPTCSRCSSPLVFYFQLGFPADSPWKNQTLSAFFCTKCAAGEVRDDLLALCRISAKDIKTDKDIQRLNDLQTSFRFLVAERKSSVLRKDYKPVIAFQRWLLKETDSVGLTSSSSIGGVLCHHNKMQRIHGNFNGTDFFHVVTLSKESKSENFLVFPAVKGHPAPSLSIADLADDPEPLFQLFGSVQTKRAAYICSILHNL
jgi:hypothetical protein